MWDFAFRNIMRQRSRSFLTVLGILIGIGAVVGLGSFAEGINASVQSSLELIAGKIQVQEKDSGFFGFTGSLNDDDLETIASISGVKEAIPTLIYVENINPFSGPERIVIGIDPDKAEFFTGENVDMEDGRQLEVGDSDSVMIGFTYAESKNIKKGDFISVKDTDFEVIGIIEKTDISDIDTSIITNIEDLQSALDKDDFQVIYVIPDDVRDVENLKADIEDSSEKFAAITSKDFARQAESIVDQIRFFTIGIGAIAAFVGGLGVMNTMIMAVMERRREIGVLKAIGATNTAILIQFMQESIILSLIGGLGGIGLGLLASFGIGSISMGMTSALVTPQLALTGLGFALFLGIVGGFYPSWKAARLDPVVCLRYE